MLRGVDLTVHAGEMVAIIGPSGSGKSTLLNILGLLDTPTSGTYLLAGQDTSQLNGKQLDHLRAQALGFVFQDSHLLPAETVARNASLGLRIQGVEPAQQESIARAAVDRLRLSHRWEAPGSTLSGGERQRVAIARGIATAPAVLLADEPTGNLDQAITEEVIQDLRHLADQGTTILIITHDDAVARRADRRLRMADGRLHPVPDEAPAPPGELATSPSRRPEPGGTDRPRRSRRAAWLSPFTEALAALTTRPGRALVLCLAYALAVTGLVASAGVIGSAAQQISTRLDAAALDEVRISPIATDFTPAQAEQAAARLQRLEGVRGVGYRAESTGDVTRFPLSVVQDQEVAGSALLAASPTYLELMGATYEDPTAAERFQASAAANLAEDLPAGRLPSRPAALLGREAAEELGVSGPDAGVSVSIAGRTVSVVGIIETGGRDPSLTRAVVLDPVTSQTLGTSDPLLLVRTQPGYPAPVAEVADLALDPVRPQDYTVQTVVDLRSLDRGVSDDIAVLGYISSWGILVLAVLSAGTTLYLSVQGRRREIALRRAIGASAGAIFRMFLAEGAFIGLMGGLLGLSLGTVTVVGVCLANGWEPVLGPAPLLTGLAAGTFSGLIAAVLPAAAAARERPAQALRG